MGKLIYTFSPQKKYTKKSSLKNFDATAMVKEGVVQFLFK